MQRILIDNWQGWERIWRKLYPIPTPAPSIRTAKIQFIKLERYFSGVNGWLWSKLLFRFWTPTWTASSGLTATPRGWRESCRRLGGWRNSTGGTQRGCRGQCWSEIQSDYLTTPPPIPVFQYLCMYIFRFHSYTWIKEADILKHSNFVTVHGLVLTGCCQSLQYCSSLDRPLTAEFYYKFIYWIPKSGTKDTLTCEFLCPKIFKVKNKNFYWLVKKIMIICQLKRNCYHYIQVTIPISIKNKTRFSVLAGKIQLDGRWRSHLVEFYQPESRILFCFYKNSSRSIDLELFLFK